MSTLYEIQGEYLALLEFADATDPEDQQTFLDTMESIQGELEIKADNYAAVIAEISANVDKFDKEIQRLTAKRDAMENNIKYMKERLFEAMKLMGVNEITGEHFKLKIQKNGGKQPVKYDIDEKTPELYPEKYQKTKIILDKDKIREDLESGVELTCAHLEERGEHLRIK